MSIFNSATGNNRNWTTKRFIDLSQNLGQAYSPRLNNTKSNRKADSWTTEKFINMSRRLSSAYGADF